MKIWLRKLAVVMVAIMTFGLYVPPGLMAEAEAEDNKDELSHSGVSEETAVAEVETPELEVQNSGQEETSHLHSLSDQAKEQTLLKLGPRITGQLDEQFMDAILDNIENTLNGFLSEIPEERHVYLSITEVPADGLGERIFNIFDAETNEDIIRFHVRRDHRPWEGYWFNFHYHIYDDQFEGHYEIGEIFWDKNMPPKWMA
ncbi:YpjP family protein [Virgibacillus kimchii]